MCATPPPSREPGQADAALEADIAAFRTEMEHWNNPPRGAALTVRIIADRTRHQERLEELEEGLRDLKWGDKEHWVDGKLQHVRMTATEMCDKARALLEVQDAK